MSNTQSFIPSKPLETAVLFLVFNRLDTTKKVFEAIRQAKPPRLYIAADGPRENSEGETEKVRAVRDYLITNIDWVCDVKTLFRDNNIGCKFAVSGAITWFFEQEEQGIILEDDCLPSQSFFWFCEEMLNHHAKDTRVGQIAGFNQQYENLDLYFDFFYTKYPAIWGWATWANRWNKYDVNLAGFKDESCMETLRTVFSKNEFTKRVQIFEEVYCGNIDTWDYQWAFLCYVNQWVTVVPKFNLISNVGFGEDATHTTGTNPWVGLELQESFYAKKIPNFLVMNEKYEMGISNNLKSDFISRVFARLVGFFNI